MFTEIDKFEKPFTIAWYSIDVDCHFKYQTVPKYSTGHW